MFVTILMFIWFIFILFIIAHMQRKTSFQTLAFQLKKYQASYGSSKWTLIIRQMAHGTKLIRYWIWFLILLFYIFVLFVFLKARFTNFILLLRLFRLFLSRVSYNYIVQNAITICQTRICLLTAEKNTVWDEAVYIWTRNIWLKLMSAKFWWKVVRPISERSFIAGYLRNAYASEVS